ncbi:hypothetical protein HN709_02430, partial [Candidatus Peregrinibacteria bacterium]|nr:hypothetical protein [Candidatus Peregrinibacteria bacterium]
MQNGNRTGGLDWREEEAFAASLLARTETRLSKTHNPGDGLPMLDETGFFESKDGTVYTGAHALPQMLAQKSGIVMSRSPIARGLSEEAQKRGIYGHGMQGDRKGGSTQITTIYPAQDCFETIWHLMKVHAEIVAHERNGVGVRIWQVMRENNFEPRKEAVDKIVGIIRAKTKYLPELVITPEEEMELNEMVPQMEAGSDGYGDDYNGERRCTLDAYIEKNEITKE